TAGVGTFVEITKFGEEPALFHFHGSAAVCSVDCHHRAFTRSGKRYLYLIGIFVIIRSRCAKPQLFAAQFFECGLIRIIYQVLIDGNRGSRDARFAPSEILVIQGQSRDGEEKSESEPGHRNVDVNQKPPVRNLSNNMFHGRFCLGPNSTKTASKLVVAGSVMLAGLSPRLIVPLCLA